MSGPALGFHSIEEEVVTALPVEGSVPDWLAGSLLRNGPGSFAVGDGEVDHWFDGLAMLRRFTFEDGAVTYQNRFLRSRAYETARRGEPISGFATGGDGGLLTRLAALLVEEPYDNANVITERVGDAYLALTETPGRVRFDPTTLETLGGAHYTGPEPHGQLACAHVHRDRETGHLVNFETEFGRTNHYHVVEVVAPNERRHVASVPVEEPAYMHSFALTPNYVVLTEFPFVVDPLDMLREGGSFVEHFRWEPERGTRFLLIDRASGGVAGEAVTEPFFAFHHVNAYEDGEQVVVDIETVPDAGSIDVLGLDALREGALGVSAGAYDRFRLTPRASGSPAIERERVWDGGMALPTVSPAVRQREHRYAYAQASDQPITEWPQAVTKVDTATGEVRQAGEDGVYLSEPVFVPRPAGEREDDGVVLTVGLDAAAERSVLFVLDGDDLSERARCPLPHALPFDFHGRFFPEVR